MSLVEAVEAFLLEHGLVPRHVAVAVSGGPDSTALLLALHELGLHVTAAHVNHHLRGDESAIDEHFIRGVAADLNIPFERVDAPLDAEAVRQQGVEAAARTARYAALDNIADTCGADLIATAHQMDDQAETLLLRLVTGSGPTRLRGIAPVLGRLIRPLLAVRRAEVLEFLAARGIVAREDQSNTDPRFLRNRVRHQLLPMLESWNPRVVVQIALTAEQVREQQAIVDSAIDSRIADAISTEGTQVIVHTNHLPENRWLRRAVLLRAIRVLEPHARDISAEDLERLESELTKRKRCSITKSLEIAPHGEEMVLRSRHRQEIEPFEYRLRAGEMRQIPEIGTSIRVGYRSEPAERSRFRQAFQIDDPADATFVVRSRREGDRFQPLGLSSEKKLNRFLIDRKIPGEVRSAIPLLLWRNEIVWVCGVEVSERFKVSDPARPVFEAAITWGAVEDDGSDD